MTNNPPNLDDAVGRLTATVKWMHEHDRSDNWMTANVKDVSALLSALVEMRGLIEKRPNIYWDFDDPESGYDSPGELAETIWTGAPMAVRVQRAVRLPDAWISIKWPDDGELEATEHETEEAARQALQKESAK